MVRLPIPGQDDKIWGDLLNEFLQVDHNPDGTLKLAGTLAGKYAKPASGIPRTDLHADVQASLAKADSAPTALPALTDVTLNAPADGQALTYDGSNNRWVNTDIAVPTITKESIGLGNVTNDAQLPLTGGTLTGMLTINGGSAATDRLRLGGDTVLYREVADVLRTDDDLKVGANLVLASLDTSPTRINLVDSTPPVSGNKVLLNTFTSPSLSLPSGLYGWNNQTLSNAASGITHAFVAAMKNNVGTNSNFAGTLSQAIGIWLPGDIRGSGTIGEYYGVKLGILPASGNTVSINNYYGLSIESPTANTHWIGNHYGIRVKDQVVSGSANAYALYTGTGRVRFGDDVMLADGKNIATGTASGMRLGTSASQKIGFFNATPVAQQAGGPLTAGGAYGTTEQTMLNAVWTALRNLGLMN